MEGEQELIDYNEEDPDYDRVHGSNQPTSHTPVQTP